MGGRANLVTPIRRQKTESRLQLFVTEMLLGVLRCKQIWVTLPHRRATYAIPPDGCHFTRPILIQLSSKSHDWISKHVPNVNGAKSSDRGYIHYGQEVVSWCWICVVSPTHIKNCSDRSNDNRPIYVYHAVKRSSGLTHTYHAEYDQR
jgi:hypothetical protein